MSDDDAEIIEIVEAPDSVELPDGSIEINIDEPEDETPGWFENLAETLPYIDRRAFAVQLLKDIEDDKKAREKRDDQYAEAIRRTGFGDDAPGGAQFNGASRVVHPLMGEAAIDFAGRVIKELFPPSGPVKSKIIPKATRELMAKAERKTRYMNWQLTEQISEYRAELEQTLTQVPMGGAQYQKWWWDKRLKRPRVEFWPIDDTFIPYAASSFYGAERITLRLTLTTQEYERRIEDGVYLDILDIPPAMAPEETKAGQATDRVEGRSRTSENIDGERIVYECYLSSADFGDGQGPYIVSIDEDGGDILSIYRNWREQDETRQALDWLVEWPFVPWRGAYPIGFPHLLGGLSAALTGTLRALLDSAHIQNMAGMLKLPGKIGGQTKTIDPTQVTEIEGPVGIDDIRKVAMAFPFNPPSVVLFQMLGFLDEQARGVVRSSVDISETNPNAPVGTTLALIEQGTIVYSAIFARQHEAQKRALAILHRLNRDNLDGDTVVEELGSLVVRPEDFDGPMDVIPVSDPTIFSEQQRLQQTQFIAGRAEKFPMLYRLPEVEKRVLEGLKIPDPDGLLAKTYEAEECDPTEENVRASLGRPIEAFPDQDHVSHLISHLAFLADPLLGSFPLVAGQILMPMVQHLREHVVYHYKAQVNETVAKVGIDIAEITSEDDGVPDEMRRGIERLEAMSAAIVHAEDREVPRVIESIMPTLQAVGNAAKQSMEMMQAMSPSPPPDPAVEVMKMDVQRKQQADQAKAQTDQAKLQIEGQKAQGQQMTDQARLQIEQQRDQAEQRNRELERQLEAQRVELDGLRLSMDEQIAAANNRTKILMNEADNEAAKQIQAAKMINDATVRDNAIRGEGPNPQART